ncbi:MAG TPA: thiamine pyrophosphate-binding protein [Polyangiaceae bacterium]|nr:thiamine pyrophosphate-binding protein [Polyangiaceae bacterium]
MARVVQLFPGGNPATPRVIDVFLRYLKAEGVRVVFGIPGGLLHPLFEAIEEDAELTLAVSKHEEGAAFMADGYARVGRRLGVCAGTSGPGATNLMTGVSCAFADGVPMLVITGQAASHALGKGAAQETSREDIDIVAMFEPVTKYSAMVASPAQMPQHLRRALRLALTGRPGPVHLNVPVDFWEKPLSEDWFDPATYRPATSTFDRAALQQAVDVLHAAQRPVLLVGSGVAIANAEQHLLALADALPARVATTPRAKGVFPEDHELSLGVFGFAGHELARKTLLGEEVDVIFTVGSSLNETATLNWHPALARSRRFIQLDIDVDRIGRNYPVDLALVGDAQTILVELVYHLHRKIRDGRLPQSLWRHADPVERGHSRYMTPEQRVSDAVPLTPARWRCDIERALPEDAVVFSDIGGHMLSNIHHLCIRGRQRFIINLGFGSMGHGTVAPIGAALADPRHPVIAIIGDACFMMNGMDLITAVEYEVPVVWIVENNNMHGITYHASKKLSRSGRPLRAASYRRPLEIAAMARAMGLRTEVVDRPGQIQRALHDALASRVPALIEVRVDPMVPPPVTDRAKSLAGFIER